MGAEEREEQLRRSIGAVLFDAMNYPEAVQARMLGQDYTPLLDKVVAAVIATDEEVPKPEPLIVEHLRTLDALLGYMSARLSTSDYSDKFVQGYSKAYGDAAHIRSTLWWDWHRADPEAAASHKINWEMIKAQRVQEKHRIFPKEN